MFIKFYTGEFYKKKNYCTPFSFHLDYTVLMTALRKDPLMFPYVFCKHVQFL